MNIILASTSPFRQQLLERLHIPFETCPPRCHENTEDGLSPEAIVTELAERKALSIADEYPSHIIIGSDCIASCEGRILCKPLSHDAASEQLRHQSGRLSTFYAGLCVLNTETESLQTGYATAAVQFRTLSAEDIHTYLCIDEPLNSSGAIKSESLGITLFESIHSTDPTAIMGLPLILLTTFLKRAGAPVFTLLSRTTKRL